MKLLFILFFIESFSLFGQSEVPYSWRFENKDNQVKLYQSTIDTFAIQKALSNDSKGMYAVAINEKVKIEKNNFFLAHLSSFYTEVFRYRSIKSLVL